MKKYLFFTIIFFIFAFSCSNGGSTGDDDNSFTVGYNSNGAESGVAPVTQKGNGNISLSVSANTGNLSKNGYFFDGWNTAFDGSGIDYAPGSLYSGKDITLYAKWAAIFNYSVVNPGSLLQSLDGVQRTQGSPTAIITGLTDRGRQLSSLNIPESIDGYTVSCIAASAFQNCNNIACVIIPNTISNIGDSAFAGCSCLSDITLLGTTPPAIGTGVLDNCSAIISVPQNAVVTYQGAPGWDTYSTIIVYIGASTYCLVYDGNGSDGGKVPMMRVSAVGGYPIIVDGNTDGLTRAGCTFNGWNTAPDGSGNAKNAGDTIQLMGGRITLYAQWYHPDYIVTFDDQGANMPVVPSIIKVVAPANTIDFLPTTLPKKDGYNFAGWYTGPNGTGNLFTVGSSVTSNLTLYAKWNINNYTLSYNGNGNTSGSVPTNQTGDYNSNIVLRTNIGNLEKTGYSFDGWNTKADGTGTSYAAGASYILTDNLTLYAKWNINNYTLSYNGNGNTSGSVPTNQTGNYNSNIVLRTNTGNLEKTGYSFDGWNTKVDGTGTSYAAGASYTLTDNLTLYAKWRELFPYSSTGGSRSGVAVGDIVLSNRATITPSNYTIHAVDISNANLTPVGVVVYEGITGSVGKTGSWYMIGLKQGHSLCWAKNGSFGYSTEFNTSDSAGEDNWSVITAIDTTGTATAGQQATNYPAFNYANTYTVEGYTSGWFLPSRNELRMICSGTIDSKGVTRRNTIFISIKAITDALGHSSAIRIPIDSCCIFSSSQFFSIVNTSVWDINSHNGVSGARNKDGNEDNFYVRVVRALD